jgi:hypothetical protein
VAEAKQLGDTLSIDQVHGVDLRGHGTTLLINTGRHAERLSTLDDGATVGEGGNQ